MDKDNTTVVSGAGDLDKIKARINEIKVQIEKVLLIMIKKSFKKD